MRPASGRRNGSFQRVWILPGPHAPTAVPCWLRAVLHSLYIHLIRAVRCWPWVGYGPPLCAPACHPWHVLLYIVLSFLTHVAL